MAKTNSNASVRAYFNSKTKVLGGELTYALEDVKLRLGLTDRTLKEDNKLTDVTIGVEKPGLFRYDWDVAKKAAKFQFQAKTTVAKQKVAMKYVHDQKANLATLEGAVPVRDNKDLVTSKYNFASEKFDVKYAWKINDSNILEPYYDFAKSALSVSLTHQRAKNEKVKATYNVKANQATLDYTKDLWRVTATMPVKKEKPNPIVTFEKTWNFTV